MNLFEQPDGTVTSSAQNTSQLKIVNVKFGSSQKINFQFTDGNQVPQEIDAALTISAFEFVLKQAGDFNGSPVVSNFDGTNWVYFKTGTGAAAVYSVAPSFSGAALFEQLITASGGIVAHRPANQTARFALTGLTEGTIVQQVDTVVYWVVVDPANLANTAGWSIDVPVALQVPLAGELLVELSDGTVTKSQTFTINVQSSYFNGFENISLTTLSNYPNANQLALETYGTLASAATTAIGAASASLNITGSVTITAFDAAAAGIKRYLVFAAAPLLTYNAASLILPGAANIQAAAGDSATFLSLGSGNWKCLNYQRVDGTALEFPSGMAWDAADKILTVTAGNSGGVSVVGGGMGGGNALKLTASASTQFSAVCFIDAASGIEHGAIGWGNQTGGSLANESYWELSDLSSSTVNNGARIVQSSTKKGYSWDPRITIGADHAPVVVYGYDSVTLAATTLTFSSLGITGATPVDGVGLLFGVDPNMGTYYRSNLFGASVNAVVYASFGDTLANAGGHVFSTGGLIGAQTVKMIIANDYITTSIPFGSTINIQDAAGGGFGQVGYDNNFAIIFRDNANANTHYCFGGLTGAGAGHRFFTGGVKASQSLRMQVADDGITAFTYFFPLQASSAPTYVKGAIYFDTSLNKLRVGAASAWETVTSV